jgi:hypothetical protein
MNGKEGTIETNFKLTSALKQELLPYVHIEFFEHDIMRFTFIKNIYVDMPIALHIAKCAKALCPNRAYRSLKILPFKMNLSEEVTNYLSGADRKDMVKAEAFMINNIPLRFFANFYMKVKRPALTSKIFNNEEEAVKWLLTF